MSETWKFSSVVRPEHVLKQSNITKNADDISKPPVNGRTFTKDHTRNLLKKEQTIQE